MDILETVKTMEARQLVAVAYLVGAVTVFLSCVWKGLRWDGSQDKFYSYYIGVWFDLSPWCALGLCFIGGVLWFPWGLCEAGIWLYCRYQDYRYKKHPPARETYASAVEKAREQLASRARIPRR